RAQHQRGDGRRRVLPAEEVPAPLPVAHLPLDQRHDLVGEYPGGLLGDPADDDIVRALEVHDRRRGVLPVAVADDRGPAGLVDPADHRVGGAEVDPVDAVLWLAHCCPSVDVTAAALDAAASCVTARAGWPARASVTASPAPCANAK